MDERDPQVEQAECLARATFLVVQSVGKAAADTGYVGRHSTILATAMVAFTGLQEARNILGFRN